MVWFPQHGESALSEPESQQSLLDLSNVSGAVVDGQMRCAVGRRLGPMLMGMHTSAEIYMCRLFGTSPIETAYIAVGVCPALLLR